MTSKSAIQAKLARFRWVQDVVVNDGIERVQVVFTFEESKEDENLTFVQMYDRMSKITLAIKSLIPAGYSLRLGGKVASGMTMVTAILNADTLAELDSANENIDWPLVADEYNVAPGMRARR